MFQVKAELVVSVHTGADVGKSGNAQFPFLVHNVHKGGQLFPGFCKGKFQFRFVVEMGIPLIAVKSEFISFRHRPDCRRNGTALFGLDGQIGAGLAALEQQLVIWDLRSPHNSGIRAAELHLFHVQIAAVGKVKLFHVIKSFLKGIPFHHHKTAEAVWCSW